MPKWTSLVDSQAIYSYRRSFLPIHSFAYSGQGDLHWAIKHNRNQGLFCTQLNFKPWYWFLPEHFAVRPQFHRPLQFWAYGEVEWGCCRAPEWQHYYSWAFFQLSIVGIIGRGRVKYVKLRVPNKGEKEMLLAYFKTKDVKMAALLSRKKCPFHTYWQPEGVIIENMSKVTASFCWYSCLKRNYGNQEKEY